MSTVQIFLVALLTFTTTTIVCLVAAEDCGPKFKGKCICSEIEYDRSIKYVVNCTDTGFRDTSVLEFVPEQTQVIIFTGNNIPEIPWNVFGAFNDLSLLSIVDMSNNHIREIRGKSFHHVTNVKRLILNHNDLSISNTDDELNHHHRRVFSNFVNLEELHMTNAFADNTSAELSRDLHDIFVNSNLTKLTKLHLEQNEIVKFADRRVFCDLPSLTDLYLGDNLLEEINFNILCLKHLRFLDLERNKFDYVRPKDLQTLDALEEIPGRTTNLTVDFRYNPFVCDCGIAGLKDWMRTTTVKVRNANIYVCYRNKKYEEIIMSLKTQKCKLAQTNMSVGHTASLIFLLTVLVFVLVGLVVSLAFLSRDRLVKAVQPVLNITPSKKVQYTTIKDEECPEVHV